MLPLPSPREARHTSTQPTTDCSASPAGRRGKRDPQIVTFGTISISRSRKAAGRCKFESVGHSPSAEWISGEPGTKTEEEERLSHRRCDRRHRFHFVGITGFPQTPIVPESFSVCRFLAVPTREARRMFLRSGAKGWRTWRRMRCPREARRSSGEPFRKVSRDETVAAHLRRESPRRGGRSSRFASSNLALAVACSRVIFRCKSDGAAMLYCGMPTSDSQAAPRPTRSQRSSAAPRLAPTDFVRAFSNRRTTKKKKSRRSSLWRNWPAE